MSLDDQIHGIPGKKKYRDYYEFSIPPLKFIIIIIITISTTIIIFEAEDRYIEGTVTHVNGTVTDKKDYLYRGGLSNGSTPLSSIEIDGKWYIAYEVDFNRWGDRGSCIIDDYQKGDHIDMELFPSHPYSIFRDGMLGMLFLLIPIVVIIGILGSVNNFKRERIA